MASDQYFKVPCNIKMRFEKISEDELLKLKDFRLRPSPISSLRTQLEHEVRGLDLPDRTKAMIERHFSILLHIDQRLSRIEDVLAHENASGPKPPAYNQELAEIGGEGMVIQTEKASDYKADELVFLDLLLPAIPEQKIEAVGRVQASEAQNQLNLRFEALHQDDKEALYRFVRFREREILRERSVSSGSQNAE